MPRLETFDVQQLLGLSEQEAVQRLIQEGHNELPSTEKRGFGRILLKVLREPMFLLMIACGGLYLILGELTEALLLLGFVFIIIGITFFQERRTERALEALRDLASPRALVVRDGRSETHSCSRASTRRCDALSRGRSSFSAEFSI